MEPIQKFSYFLEQHKIYYTNSNIKQKLHKKKKKNTAQRAAGKSARRSAHSRSAHARERALPPPLHAVADERVPLVRPSSSLSLRDADGVAPPVSSSFLTRGGTATAPAAVSEVLDPCARAHWHRLISATPLLSPKRALPSPSTSATRKAGGRHSRPQAGH